MPCAEVKYGTKDNISGEGAHALRRGFSSDKRVGLNIPGAPGYSVSASRALTAGHKRE